MQAIILAAGESSRFWPLNSRHKSLFRILGKPVIQHCIDGLKKSGADDIIIVQGKGKCIENSLDSQKGVRFVEQQEPMGMGNALLCAKELIEGDFIVANAERFDISDFVKKLYEKKKKTGSGSSILCSRTDEPWLYGIVEPDGDFAKGIIEKPKRGEEKSCLKASGIYLLEKEFLDFCGSVKEHMYSFEEALDGMMKQGKVSILVSDSEILPMKYPWHLFSVSREIMKRSMKPKISKTAKICRNVSIEGEVFIGENAVIFENASIKGPCYIGDDCMIGNNAIVREFSDIESLSTIGANCEFARSIAQDNVHLHSGFVGDSIIGSSCRIGAGIITANVRLDRREVGALVGGDKTGTGMKSLGCIVGENTLIGIGARTMPGVMIGSGCTIGPCSLVSRNLGNCQKLFCECRE